jgi:hypothetical protein
MALDKFAEVLDLVLAWRGQNPAKCTSVHGSALEFERSEITSIGTDRWHVFVPEVEPLGLPMGLELVVDLRLRTCEPCDVE